MMNAFIPATTARILVAGDLILDRYVHGTTTRISPEAPVPIVKVEATEDRPGGAANVALNISALGLDVALLGVSGCDEAADIVMDTLTAKGVQCHFQRQKDFSTTTKLRVLSQHQQLLRLDYETGTGTVDAEKLYALYQEAIKNAAVVVLSDYAKGSLENVAAYIKLARQHKIRVLVDPKGSDFEPYRYASLLTPNLKEFEAVVGPCSNADEIMRQGQVLCESLHIDTLLVTRGAQGMSLIQANNDTPLHFPAETHEVFDVTGAGDTVIATLAAALASDYDMAQAVAYANHAAGLVVEKLGTASITSVELNKTIAGIKPADSCIISADSLADKARLWRQQNRKLVMTNGCFDLLHAGHVQYLQAARALGDCLIVAVNDDQSLRQLKGQGRPVNPLHQRMTVLAGLAAVDWLVSFSEATPAELIRKIQPHILVKGGDYHVGQIAGASFVQAYGGEVVILPFQKGCSTTQMLNRLGKNTEAKDS